MHGRGDLVDTVEGVAVPGGDDALVPLRRRLAAARAPANARAVLNLGSKGKWLVRGEAAPPPPALGGKKSPAHHVQPRARRPIGGGATVTVTGVHAIGRRASGGMAAERTEPGACGRGQTDRTDEHKVISTGKQID